MSIRTKITLIVLLLLALAGLLFALYSIDTTANYRRLRVEGVTKTVQYAGEHVNKSIRVMEQNAVDLAKAGRLLFISGNRSDELGESLVVENFKSFPASVGGGIWFEPGLFRANKRLACFYALRNPKTGQVDLDPNFQTEKYNYLAQSWYREIAAKAKYGHLAVWTRPYYDDTGSFALMTTVGSGIFDADGKFVGMSTVDWEIDHVINTLSDVKPTTNAFVLLAVPAQNYVITNTSDGSAGGVLGGIAWYKDIRLPEKNTVAIDSIHHGGTDYLAFSMIMDNGWLFSVPIPRDEIFSEIENRNKTFTAIMIASSIVILGLAWWLVSRLVNKPIARLIGDVETIGAGDLGYRVQVRSKDEIGRLGAAFNRMTGDLSESMERTSRERAERERIAGELDVATQIQTSMLPCTFPAFPERSEFDVYAAMTPAREVGGDFYDFFIVDGRNHLCVVMADVSGKGIPAALFMVIARTLIKNNAQSGKSPAEVFRAVNNLLGENNDAGMFVTAFIGFLDVDTGEFRYVNAGHNPPFLCRAGGVFDSVSVKNNLMLAVLPDFDYEEERLRLESGDTIFLYTDGVTEAANPEQDMFGLERTRDSLNRRRRLSPHEILTGIKADVDAFAAGAEQSDDITMLALRMADAKSRDTTV